MSTRRPAATAEAIDAKVRKRAAWIRRQQRYFTQYLPRTPERRYMAGETHLYLGRQHRLKIQQGEPDGVKVASGQSFDIYVVKKESKPFAATGFMLNIFESAVVVHQTRKHGRQRYGSRAEAIDADLLNPAMWQVGDFEGDGFDDYRFVAQVGKKGCRTWNTWLWLPDKERFAFGAKINYQTDAGGKPVKVCL